MPTFVVTAPDGKEYDVDAPRGATQEQALAYFQQNWKPQEAPKEKSWGDVGISAVKNLPSSAYEFGKSLVDGYSYGSSGKMVEFCWTVVDDMIRVVYLHDASVRVYRPEIFSKKTDK